MAETRKRAGSTPCCTSGESLACTATSPLPSSLPSGPTTRKRNCCISPAGASLFPCAIGPPRSGPPSHRRLPIVHHHRLPVLVLHLDLAECEGDCLELLVVGGGGV